MQTVFDPATWWPLWVFLPIMRYIIFPMLTEWEMRSYIVLVPLFILICIYTIFGHVTGRIVETLVGGLILVTMLSVDLCQACKKLEDIGSFKSLMESQTKQQ